MAIVSAKKLQKKKGGGIKNKTKIEAEMEVQAARLVGDGLEDKAGLSILPR
jgi:hypothetical protein